MSGGHFDYKNDNLCYEVFGWDVSATYDIGTHKLYKDNIKEVRNANPFEDKIISELIYDVFCLMHSYDWYVSGDTNEETYQTDVKAFKDKWLKGLSKNKEFISKFVEDELKELESRLRNDLGLNDTTEPVKESTNND